MLRHAISWSLTLIPFASRRGSSTQSTISPLVVVVAAIRSTTAAWLMSGRPRQVWVMWQNKRCSIVRHLAQGLVREVMHVDRLGRAFRPVVVAAVLEGANQFLLLGVDRDHRLAGLPEGAGPGVDVGELAVAIGMAGALQGLAVGLPAVAQFLPQQLADRVRADRVAHRTQFVRELGVTLGNPQQRPHWIAKGCRLDQAAQIRQERRILVLHGLATAAGTTDLARRQGRLIQIGQPPPDGAAGNPSD